jgi:hypothetical protein
MARYLIAHGANINDQYEEGQTGGERERGRGRKYIRRFSRVNFEEVKDE